MSRHNLAAAQAERQRRRQIAEDTKRLLLAYPHHTPSYFPVQALIDMQQHVGHRANSSSKLQRKPSPFTTTERPRQIAGGVTTPSWFRYAAMDAPSKLPQGYEWDVSYFRREDGLLTTQPALSKIPELPVPPAKREVHISEYTRATDVRAELSDEGIEDISSDDELYTRGDHMFKPREYHGSSSDSSDEEIEEPRPATGLLDGMTLRSARTRARTTLSIASDSSKTTPEVTARPTKKRRYEDVEAAAVVRNSRASKRVDSRLTSFAEARITDTEDEVVESIEVDGDHRAQLAPGESDNHDEADDEDAGDADSEDEGADADEDEDDVYEIDDSSEILDAGALENDDERGDPTWK